MSDGPKIPPLDYQALFDTMAVTRAIVRSEKGSKNLLVVDINQRGLKYLDRKRENVVGYYIHEVLDMEVTEQLQQACEVCKLRKKVVTVQTSATVSANLKVYGFVIKLAEGIECPEGETYFDIVAQPNVLDESILQKERDDAISMLTSIFDVSEIGIVVTDSNARIVRVNDSFVRAFGWEKEELINVQVSSLVTPDERLRAVKNHEEYISTGTRTSGEMKIIRKDGSIANALFTTATLELSEKRRFQVTTIMDISLRKQMEETLRNAKTQADTANRAKSSFLANMSHELRTPMNAVIGFSEMMLKETFGPLGNEKYKEYLHDIHMSACHLLDIINEVLDMSKIEAGKIELDDSEFDLLSLIDSVVRMMDSRAFADNIELVRDIQENLPNIIADQKLIRQVLINLITNAIKFSPKETHICIRSMVDFESRLVIEVEDHGIGIPEDKIEQALEPFGQVFERAENSHDQGTGLGLPLAKAMMELHGGELRIQSEIGKGTIVSIFFPAFRVRSKSSEMHQQSIQS